MFLLLYYTNTYNKGHGLYTIDNFGKRELHTTRCNGLETRLLNR